jgi:zinc protease
VVGDTTLDEIVPRIEKLFRGWEAAEVPGKNIATVEIQPDDVLYLIDKPGAEQSIIFAGQLVIPMANPDEIAIDAFNDMLGGQFSSRINMNLREEKHWSYGARSTIVPTRAQRPFFAYASVQTDKTSESVAEILREITEIRDTNPPTAVELERVQRSNILSLPGRWETNPAVLGAVTTIVNFGLPDDFWNTYPQRLDQLTLEQVTRAGQAVIDPANLTWVVIGDRERILAGLEELGLGEIRLIDVEGQPIAAPVAGPSAAETRATPR